MFVCMSPAASLSVLLHDTVAGLEDIGILGQLHTYIHTYIGCLLVEVPTGLRDITYAYRFHFALGLVQLQELLMSTLRDDPPT